MICETIPEKDNQNKTEVFEKSHKETKSNEIEKLMHEKAKQIVESQVSQMLSQFNPTLILKSLTEITSTVSALAHDVHSMWSDSIIINDDVMKLLKEDTIEEVTGVYILQMTRILFPGRMVHAPKIFAIEGNPTPPN